jgi:hypothetical protein
MAEQNERYTLVRGKDTIEVEILPNGEFKILTPGQVSPENHATAESLLGTIATLGFTLQDKQKRGHGQHSHSHGHTHHVHEGSGSGHTHD